MTGREGPPVPTAVENRGHDVTLAFSDGSKVRFHAAWLRDNSPAPDSRDPANGQRLFDIAALAGEIGVKGARISPQGDLELLFAPDGHQTCFTAAWLLAHRHGQVARSGPLPVFWGGELGQNLPRGTWPQVRNDRRALRAWLAGFAAHGVALLTGCPTTAGFGAEVIALFGYVRETNYGRVFDVVSKIDPNNLAYTALPLSPHTDNPYRDPVPQLQLLHCLNSDAEGGLSIVVDGFRAAERLRREAPAAFELLARHAVPFRFRDATVELSARAPILEVDDRGELHAVRWNNRSAAPFDLPDEVMPRYYEAYRHFGRLLQDPAAQVIFHLAPGEAFLVDNRRVLHGRTGFSGSGGRHLQGWYADKDGLLSTLAVLERELRA